MIYLALLVNAASSMLAALTLATYVFAYTPLKRITSLNTLVGAIPGALPPVIGWAAARGGIGAEAWVLFSILFCWQMPHFLAIAWMYREDYARAGFIMLPNVDSDGGGTGRQAVNYAAALLVVSLLPTITGLTIPVYFFGAFLLGAGMVYCAVRMQRDATPQPRAPTLFCLDHLPAAAAWGCWRCAKSPREGKLNRKPSIPH